MRLILVGPPGAGKGTQAVHLASHFSIPHISTGDIFRLNIKGETKLGLHAKSFMDAGNLVPDSVTNDMVADRLTHADAKAGFLLDGYPRNIGQADFLKENLENSGTPLDAVLEFKLENAEIIKRLSGRRACRGCGGTSHVIFEAPKVAGVCDSCGGELYQRSDDAESVIANRLAVYADQTEPIISYYKSAGLLKTISAVGEVSDIAARAIAALK
ncbi:adenylate kinase [freshwater metagenome]|uniref:Adenylate kinase n=1 Tax=freshwater metagenome TaxID=449393 RepID=A0A094Q0H2_9ZZZZ